MNFLKELWEFIKYRRKFWLIPPIVFLLLLGFLIIAGGGGSPPSSRTPHLGGRRAEPPRKNDRPPARACRSGETPGWFPRRWPGAGGWQSPGVQPGASAC